MPRFTQLSRVKASCFDISEPPNFIFGKANLLIRRIGEGVSLKIIREGF